MRLVDLTLIIASRTLAGAVDRDTATEQVVVLCEQLSREPADLVVELAQEICRLKSALAAAKKPVGLGR